MRNDAPGWSRPGTLLALATSLTLLADTTAGAEVYEFATPAPWIEVLEADYDAEGHATATNGAWIVLFDRQVDVRSDGDHHYQHLAIKLTSAVGASEYSQIDLAVDPTFQTLQIHQLRVVRDGDIIDQRRTARITELPQETELPRRVYNGRYNVNVLLSDVRAGDVIEYSYTVQSREDLFPGHFAARFDTGWSIPVQSQRIRVRSPAERPLAYRSSDGSVLPEPERRGGFSELVLTWRDRPAFAVDFTTPGWFTLWPYVELSDLRDWADVTELVDPLFRTPLDLGPRVAAVVAGLREESGTAEQLALRALRQVQQEISYTSIAIGRGSHEPTHPDTVLERRFGDCKDKSMLLASILGELGIDARVALVHTVRGRALDEALPTPYAFDHAIVRAQIGDAVYWLDPTSAPQYEPLSAERPAYFERALLLSKGSASLELVPQPAVDARRKDIVTVIDLSAGVEAPGTLDVTTRFAGALADTMRDFLARGSSEQRQTDYETYTARYYPSARSLAPIAIRDDRERNILEVHETYRLESPFTRNGDGVLELALHADELYSYAEPLGAGARETPLALEYPIQIRQRIRAALPENWPIEPESATVENPAFRFRSDVRYSGRTLNVSYDYGTLADHVPTAAVARFEADRARMNDSLGYVLTYDTDALGAGNLAVAPLPMLAALAALGLALWGAIRWGYRYDPEPRAFPASAPVGISGWLVLPALSAIITPFAMGYTAVVWLGMIQAEVWHGLPTIVKEGYDGTAHTAVVVIMCAAITLTVLHVLAAVLFFTKRSSAPQLFVGLSWISVFFVLGAVLWGISSGLDTETRPERFGAEMVRDTIATLIWTAYMASSRRVAATFVRRRTSRASAPGSDASTPLVPRESTV